MLQTDSCKENLQTICEANESDCEQPSLLRSKMPNFLESTAQGLCSAQILFDALMMEVLVEVPVAPWANAPVPEIHKRIDLAVPVARTDHFFVYGRR